MVDKSKTIQEALSEVQRNAEQKRVERLMNEWETVDEANLSGLVKGAYGLTSKALQNFAAKQAAQKAATTQAKTAAQSLATKGGMGVNPAKAATTATPAAGASAATPAAGAAATTATTTATGAAAPTFKGAAQQLGAGVKELGQATGQAIKTGATKTVKAVTPLVVPAAQMVGGGVVGGYIVKDKPAQTPTDNKEPKKQPDTPRPVTDTPRPVADTPRPVADTPRPVADTPRPVADTPRPVARTAQTPQPTPAQKYGAGDPDAGFKRGMYAAPSASDNSAAANELRAKQYAVDRASASYEDGGPKKGKKKMSESTLIDSFLELQNTNAGNMFEAAKKLSVKQKKIAKLAGDPNKIDAADLAALRSGKKPMEEAKKPEGWETSTPAQRTKFEKKTLSGLAKKTKEGQPMEEESYDWSKHTHFEHGQHSARMEKKSGKKAEPYHKPGSEAAKEWKRGYDSVMKEEVEHVDEKYMGFEKLKKSIAAKGDVRDPGAVAAAIGRKKYGKAKFQKAAAAGKKMKGMEEEVEFSEAEIEHINSILESPPVDSKSEQMIYKGQRGDSYRSNSVPDNELNAESGPVSEARGRGPKKGTTYTAKGRDEGEREPKIRGTVEHPQLAASSAMGGSKQTLRHKDGSTTEVDTDMANKITDTISKSHPSKRADMVRQMTSSQQGLKDAIRGVVSGGMKKPYDPKTGK